MYIGIDLLRAGTPRLTAAHQARPDWGNHALQQAGAPSLACVKRTQTKTKYNYETNTKQKQKCYKTYNNNNKTTKQTRTCYNTKQHTNTKQNKLD